MFLDIYIIMIFVFNLRWLFKFYFYLRVFIVVVKCLKYVVKFYFGQEIIWGLVFFSCCKNGVGFWIVYDWVIQMKLVVDFNIERLMCQIYVNVVNIFLLNKYIIVLLIDFVYYFFFFKIIVDFCVL